MKQIIVMVALGGCAADAGAPEPIARVPRANGNIVEYYEATPGTLVASEVGPAGNDFLDRETLGLSPEELRAVVTKEVATPQISVAGACNQSWFTTTQCNYSNWMWSECLVPIWNGAWGECDMNNYSHTMFFTSVCADIGDVALDVSTNIGVGGIWSVNQGYTRNYLVRVDNGSLDAHSQVDSAQGDRLLFTTGCSWQ